MRQRAVTRDCERKGTTAQWYSPTSSIAVWLRTLLAVQAGSHVENASRVETIAIATRCAKGHSLSCRRRECGCRGVKWSENSVGNVRRSRLDVVAQQRH